MDVSPENFRDFGGHSPASHSEMATHSRQPFQIAATCVFLALSAPAVLLRLWVRKFVINSLGADDYVMVAALVNKRLLPSSS